MEEFTIYLSLGVKHILSLSALDHIAFLMVLIAPFKNNEWKSLLVLITAFTIGHSLSLLFGVYKWVSFSQEIIEFLIPLSIFLTGVFHFFSKGIKQNKLAYLLALAFGLIHGLGFSNYLSSMMSDSNIAVSLLGFNLGVEIGQIVVVGLIVLAVILFEKAFSIPYKNRTQTLLGIGVGMSIVLTLQADLLN